MVELEVETVAVATPLDPPPPPPPPEVVVVVIVDNTGVLSTITTPVTAVSASMATPALS